ncbi:glycosyltransferase, partial [Arthrospira platensis SPKY1]|nr:glycosyltransferase [Arthrospira platensis SPKY1]
TTKILFLRRGLIPMPELNPLPPQRTPLKLLTVGRLVEKMGYPQLLAAMAQLKKTGLQFHLTLIGGGPLQLQLQSDIKRLGIDDSVTMTGPLPYDTVCEYYRQAHVFLFTGIVASSGDRAGFP